MTDETEPLLSGPEPPEPVMMRRADAMARADLAWRTRVAGGTWAQAAQIAGYSNAQNACRSVRETYGTLPQVERDEQRRLWRDRLEALWQQVYRDTLDRQPGAVTAAVRVATAAARLDGLDAPTEVVVHNPTQQQLEAWVDKVLALSAPALEEGDIFGL